MSAHEEEFSVHADASEFDASHDETVGPRRSQRNAARGRKNRTATARRGQSGRGGRGTRGGRGGRNARARGRGSNGNSRANVTIPRIPAAEFQNTVLDQMNELRQQVSSLASTVKTVVTNNVESRDFSPASHRVVTSFKPATPAPSSSKGQSDRDLSPVSDEDNLSETDLYGHGLEIAGSQKKLTEKAEKVFASLPSAVQKQLPIVSASILHKLLSEKQFVNLNDLLPRNRTPSTVVGTKTLCVDADGNLGMKVPPKQDSINDFTQWVRAFNVLKMYRVAVNPSLAIPMSKYLDYITQLASPSHGYLVDQWLNYDRQCRLAISRDPSDLSLWMSKNDEAYNEYLNQPNAFAAGSAQTASASGRASAMVKDKGCYLCHEPGHMWRDCPERQLDQQRSQSFVNQSFLQAPAGSGASKKDQTCFKWNEDGCNDSPICRYGRQHRCKKCGSRYHRQSGCKNPTTA